MIQSSYYILSTYCIPSTVLGIRDPAPEVEKLPVLVWFQFCQGRGSQSVTEGRKKVISELSEGDKMEMPRVEVTGQGSPGWCLSRGSPGEQNH